MKKDNVLVLQVISTPIGGGAEVLVRELNHRLCQYEITSEAIYFSKKGIQLRNSESELKIGIRNPLAIFKLRKIFCSKLPSFDRLIVHSHLTWPFFYVVLAGIGLNIKFIFTEHSTFNRRRKIPLLKYIERLFYARYCKIICISYGVQKKLNKWLGADLKFRTTVISNGVHLYTFKKNRLLLKKINFVSVGSLKKGKNFEIILKTLSFLKNND